MTDMEVLLARLDAMESRLAVLEAERAKNHRKMVYNWHLTEPADNGFGAHMEALCNSPAPMGSLDELRKSLEPNPPTYEHYIDPAMRMTRNG